MIDNIVNEIIIASYLLKTNNVNVIASELGYQPILIINALFKGERDGKFVYIKKKQILNISEDVQIEALAVTEGVLENLAVIEEFIANENSIETDMSMDELRTFIPQCPELHIKIGLFVSDKLATYEYADPKDKESVYTFITLKENKDKVWGAKQFDPSKSLASKAAKKAARKAEKQAQ